MAQISFYGQWHCADCGATGGFEPIKEGGTPHSDHKCAKPGPRRVSIDVWDDVASLEPRRSTEE